VGVNRWVVGVTWAKGHERVSHVVFSWGVVLVGGKLRGGGMGVDNYAGSLVCGNLRGYDALEAWVIWFGEEGRGLDPSWCFVQGV